MYIIPDLQSPLLHGEFRYLRDSSRDSNLNIQKTPAILRPLTITTANRAKVKRPSQR